MFSLVSFYLFKIHPVFSLHSLSMATARPPSASALVVHQLVELFRSNGHRILHERNKVCLTSDSLTLLNNYFQAANLDFPLPISSDRPRTNSLPPLPVLPSVQHLRISTKLREDLIFLHDFIQKIQAVKVGAERSARPSTDDRFRS